MLLIELPHNKQLPAVSVSYMDSSVSDWVGCTLLKVNLHLKKMLFTLQML